ncbi:MAG TPA: lysophospholipid acyltransferase family protein [Microbacteriaceae bacterium]|nr:lysophospholipid acyltransferase family protein [Microbacteriaceae bacterium]
MSDRLSVATPVAFAPEKRRPSFFWFLGVLVLPLWACLVRYRYHGRALPLEGAFVLAPNHNSEIDPIVMGVAAWKLGRAPRFMAKASLFRIPVLKWLLNASGQIPVERSGSRSHSAFRAAERLVERGQMVIVYPEGTLTRDPELWPMRGKTGAIRLALEHNIPVIPVAHWGTQALMPRYGKRIHGFPRKTIHINIGAPLDLSDVTAKADAAALTDATDRLMAEIARLLGELRGELAPATRWDPVAHKQSETGRFEASDG